MKRLPSMLTFDVGGEWRDAKAMDRCTWGDQPVTSPTEPHGVLQLVGLSPSRDGILRSNKFPQWRNIKWHHSG